MDDDPVSQELIAALLAQARPDVTVVHATSGAAAIDLVRHQRPDVVMVAMQLRDMSGMQFFRQLRVACMGQSLVPVVAISSDAMIERVLRSLDAGFFDYVVKPIEFARLLAIIDRALRLPR